MLRAINAASGPVSAAPTPVREAQAAVLSLGAAQATNTVSVEAPQSTAQAGGGPTFRYNSSEFVYRQDLGLIVLVGQSPETGERTIQIPSEEALRAYERTMRSEERATLLAQQLQGGSGASAAAKHATTTAPAAPAAKVVPLQNFRQAVAAVVSNTNSSGVVSVSA